MCSKWPHKLDFPMECVGTSFAFIRGVYLAICQSGASQSGLPNPSPRLKDDKVALLVPSVLDWHRAKYTQNK